jgi:hypothetical protein
MSTDTKSTETNNACETGMGTAVASFLVGATAEVAAGIMLAPRAAELAGEVKASASDMARRGAKQGHEVVNDTANALHMAGAA